MSIDEALSHASDNGISQAGMLFILIRHLGADPASAGLSPFVIRALEDQTSAYFQDGLLRVPAETTAVQTMAAVTARVTAKSTARPRKPVSPKPPPKRTKRKSAVEIDSADWDSRHVAQYFEIIWCEQGWRTAPPTLQAKDRANIKRLFDEYGKDIKQYIDYVFGNWKALAAKANITGLPNISILWGFRNSFAPLAFGDTALSGSKSWGTSHDQSQSRDSGDEIGW